MASAKPKILGLKDVSFVKSKGVFVSTPFFNARVLTEDNTKLELHLCVVCPKKFFKKAVTRNKVKRRIRAAFYEALKKTENIQRIKISILPSKTILSSEFEQLVLESLNVINSAKGGKNSQYIIV